MHKPEHITLEEFMQFSPNPDLDLLELTVAAAILNYSLWEIYGTFELANRLRKRYTHLNSVYKHLLEANLLILAMANPGFKTNEQADILSKFSEMENDIGISFEDFQAIDNILKKLDEEKPRWSKKSTNRKINIMLCLTTRAHLEDIIPNLGWHKRGETALFEDIIHFLMGKMGVAIVSDKSSKTHRDDLTEETVKDYIKETKKIYESLNTQEKNNIKQEVRKGDYFKKKLLENNKCIIGPDEFTIL